MISDVAGYLLLHGDASGGVLARPPEPTVVKAGSTRKFVIPNNFSRRPPTWLETASETSVDAPEVPLCVLPALRAVPSELVRPSASSVTMSLPGNGGSER